MFSTVSSITLHNVPKDEGDSVEVKDQLRLRMEQLKITVPQVAKAIGVSNQSVRHWLSGRSFPGKRHVPALEKYLSFKIDFSEGAVSPGPTVETALERTDIELFLLISKVPAPMKVPLYRLVEEVIKIGHIASTISDQPPANSSIDVKHSRRRS
jgi:transcriptional regulator with XRE-family HTH domain